MWLVLRSILYIMKTLANRKMFKYKIVRANTCSKYTEIYKKKF